MKLKSIKKISSAVRYDIKVFDENGCFIESFKINYVDMNHDELTKVITNKYFTYMNCKVIVIDTRAKADGTSWLEISVEI